MTIGVNWLNEIELIERPKPKPPLLKDVLLKMLKETAKDHGLVVSVPKGRRTSTQTAYGWARKMGFQHHMEFNGEKVYLWWTPRKQAKKKRP